MLWPVYVASKGRAVSCRLPSVDAPSWLVVEPTEVDAYTSQPAGHWGTTTVLPASGRGLPYVREWIKQHAQAQGYAWYWMLDDDISSYYAVQGGRCVACTAQDALAGAQDAALLAANVGQVALEYRQFAWSARRPYVVNSYCDVAVAIQAQETRALHFCPATDLKVDRDFTLQVVAAGLYTVRATRWAFSAPQNGSNAGGLAGDYAQAGREATSSAAFAARWPGVVTVQRKATGRVDAHVAWRQFAPHRRGAVGA